jgi:catechol 2,3-dioxygenase
MSRVPQHEDRPIKMFHHFALDVADMDRSIAFYRDLLGFKLTERHKAGEVPAIPFELAFLRCGNHHHDLVLSHNTRKKYRARTPADDAEGPAYIHHFAFACQDRASWSALLEKVRARGIQIIRGPVLHSPWQKGGEGSWGENLSFYIHDPDGHRLELFCDMATIDADGTFVTHDGERIEQAKAVEI